MPASLLRYRNASLLTRHLNSTWVDEKILMSHRNEKTRRRKPVMTMPRTANNELLQFVVVNQREINNTQL